ncbi:MAG TPA: 16S rRNA (guanine(527)-N(7))-methyltransferase RsmG [Xanthobacteraceae bacterium]|nr:16S rRNA (guanine(527)-N(7))-methyltransferase RsmG [Xanthobacteraceae bacterium]
MSPVTPDPDLAADKAAALALTPVSRETERRLDRLVARLLQWQGRMNLVAPSTLPHVWTRHIADSLQLLTLAPEARVWVDLGSGAGFPGLPIACALKDRSGAAVHLVESNGRKAAFLRDAARETGAPAVVHAERIETFVRTFTEQADVVTARALAPLPRLLGYAAPLLAKGACGLFLKGQDVEAELTESAKHWRLDVEIVPSVTESRARIVRVRKAQPLESSRFFD